ncbi:MAG: cytochrome c oxidase assembly protein [Acidimicrobiaceae bacterium]|nr:cytochrome c oxidase assembly protein [Acidimicrobiaceae bacterium]
MVAVDVTFVNFFSRVTFHPLWTVGLLAALIWYVRSARRAANWPPVRTACFLGGLLVVAVATLSGLTSWDTTNFTVQAVQQMLLSMVAPVLLLVSAPLHLALETTGPRGGRVVKRATGSVAARVLTNPVVAWLLYAACFAVVYFTGLYRLGVDHGWVNGLIGLGMLLAGLIFYTPVIGEDLPPRRMPQPARLLYFIVGLPFFTIIGMALESQHRTLAPGLTLSDVHTGGGVLWTAGEFVSILGTIAMLVVWLRQEELGARRRDELDEDTALAQAAAWRAEREAAQARPAQTRQAQTS